MAEEILREPNSDWASMIAAYTSDDENKNTEPDLNEFTQDNRSEESQTPAVRFGPFSTAAVPGVVSSMDVSKSIENYIKEQRKPPQQIEDDQKIQGRPGSPTRAAALRLLQEMSWGDEDTTNPRNYHRNLLDKRNNQFDLMDVVDTKYHFEDEVDYFADEEMQDMPPAKRQKLVDNGNGGTAEEEDAGAGGEGDKDDQNSSGGADDGFDSKNLTPEEKERIKLSIDVANKMVPIRAKITRRREIYCLVMGFTPEMSHMGRAGRSYLTPVFLCNGATMTLEELRKYAKDKLGSSSVIGSLWLYGKQQGRVGWVKYRHAIPPDVQMGQKVLHEDSFVPKFEGYDSGEPEWDLQSPSLKATLKRIVATPRKAQGEEKSTENRLTRNIKGSLEILKKSLPTVLMATKKKESSSGYAFLLDAFMSFSGEEMKFAIYADGKYYSSINDASAAMNTTVSGSLRCYCVAPSAGIHQYVWKSVFELLKARVRQGDSLLNDDFRMRLDPDLPAPILSILNELASFGPEKIDDSSPQRREQLREVATAAAREAKEAKSRDAVAPKKQGTYQPRKFLPCVPDTAISSRLQMEKFKRRKSHSSYSYSPRGEESISAGDDERHFKGAIRSDSDSNSDEDKGDNEKSSFLFSSDFSEILQECPCTSASLSSSTMESIRLRNESVKKDYANFTTLDEHPYSGLYLGRLLSPQCCPVHTTSQRKIVLPTKLLWELWPITGALMTLRIITENILRARDDFKEFWIYQSAVAIKRGDYPAAALMRRVAFAVAGSNSRSFKAKASALKKVLKQRSDTEALDSFERISRAEEEWQRTLMFACSTCESRFVAPGLCTTCGEQTKFVPDLII